MYNLALYFLKFLLQSLDRDISDYLSRCGEVQMNFSDSAAFIVGGKIYTTGDSIDVDGDTYMIQEFVGKGAMTAVWKAVHKVSEKVVSLRIYLGEISDKSRESISMAAATGDVLNRAFFTPKDGKVQRIDKFDSEKFIAVADFYEGTDLYRELENAFRIERGLLALLFLCEGLDIWEEDLAKGGILHRDIKPINVLAYIPPCGIEGNVAPRFFIIDPDFMILRAVRIPGAFLTGTPNYIAPEMVRTSEFIYNHYDLGRLFDPCLNISESDLYAIGATGFVMATRAPSPFLIMDTGLFEQLNIVFNSSWQLDNSEDGSSSAVSSEVPDSVPTPVYVRVLNERANGIFGLDISEEFARYSRRCVAENREMESALDGNDLAEFREAAGIWAGASLFIPRVVSKLVSVALPRFAPAKEVLKGLSQESVSEVVGAYYALRSIRDRC